MSFADSGLSLADRIADFHSQLSGAMGCGAWPEVEIPCSSGRTFAMVMALQNLSRRLWGGASPFHVSALSASLNVASSVNP